jgi:hypothetical protein
MDDLLLTSTYDLKILKETDPVLKGFAAYHENVMAIQREAILAPLLLAENKKRTPERDRLLHLIHLQDAIVSEYMRLERLCNKYCQAPEEERKDVLEEMARTIPARYTIQR